MEFIQVHFQKNQSMQSQSFTTNFPERFFTVCDSIRFLLVHICHCNGNEIQCFERFALEKVEFIVKIMIFHFPPNHWTILLPTTNYSRIISQHFFNWFTDIFSTFQPCQAFHENYTKNIYFGTIALGNWIKLRNIELLYYIFHLSHENGISSNHHAMTQKPEITNWKWLAESGLGSSDAHDKNLPTCNRSATN